MGKTTFLGGKRGSGRTTLLIQASYATGYPIVVNTESEAKNVMVLAEKLGFKIDEPVLVHTLRRGGFHYDNVLLDNAGEVIGDALRQYLGVNVVTAVLTDK